MSKDSGSNNLVVLVNQKGSVYEKGYGIIPKKVMLMDISIEAKAIYSFFMSYAGSGFSCFPSVEHICRSLKISKDRFYRHFNQLKINDLICVRQEQDDKGKFKRNIYEIVIIPYPQNKDTVVDNNPHPYNEDTEKPYTEKPCTENSTTNNNNTNNNIINNNTTTNSVVVDDFCNKIEKVTKRKITKNKVRELIQKHGQEKVESKINSFKQLSEGKQLKNPIGFFIAAVEQDFDTKPSNNMSFNSFPQHEYQDGELENLIEKI